MEAKDLQSGVLGSEDIQTITNFVQKLGLKKVVLQFPLEQLKDSVEIQEILCAKTADVSFFILSDNITYMHGFEQLSVKNSCCLDFIGAKHVNADGIVHFGDACFSHENTTSNIPSLFILPRVPELNSASFLKDFDAFALGNPFKSLLILFDLGYEHLKSGLIEHLKTMPLANKTVYTSYFHHELPPEAKNIVALGQNRFVMKHGEEVWPPPELDVLFLGNEDSFLLLSYVLAMPPANLWLYNVSSGGVAKSTKAQSAQTFGVIVNNPTIARWKEVQLSVKQMLRANGKKFYDLVMIKVTEQKLQNFMEIDMFIMISCAFAAIYDPKEFHRVILTPFELEVAFNMDKWAQNSYILDIKQLSLQHSSGTQPGDEETKEEGAKNSTELMVKDKGEIAEIKNIFQTIDHYEGRKYKGVQSSGPVREDDSEVKLAEVGRKGIAMAYDDELKLMK